MNYTSQFYIANYKLNYYIRLFVTYLPIFLFCGLVCFVSLSVRSFINDTMSITIIEPQAIQNEDVLENTSVTIRTNKSDTIHSILSTQNFSEHDIKEINKLIKITLPSFSLKTGQLIKFDYNFNIEEGDDEDLVSETRSLNKMIISLEDTKSLEITKNLEKFEAKIVSVTFNKFFIKSEAIIKTNLMSALQSLGLSSNNIVEIINSYSYQIDFQRQIQPGDKITVINEKLISENDETNQKGRIVYASLNLSGIEYNIYRYKNNSSNEHIFFSEDGKSVKRSLLKTPINVARISSHYGNRIHPIHGYTIMHKGIDFSAPHGTPIIAAGDGTVIEAGWKPGYGNFIQIKHSSTLTTAYAHASRFAAHTKLGAKVKQGQIIAYVGKTGRTTGDHLHYEVKINGKHVNPTSIKTTPGIELKHQELASFAEFKNKFKHLKTRLNNNIEVAENNISFVN